MYNQYVYEKLSELERERVDRRVWQPQPAGQPVGVGVMRAAGAALRRLGERLESRAEASEGEGQRIWVRVP